MTTDIRITAGGVTNFLVNSAGSPVVGGAATAAATTPFSLLNEDWTMQATPPNAVYQGGPPISTIETVAYQSYGKTQQTIPITVQGSSHDNTVALLRGLRRLLNQTLAVAPATLYYKPNTATNPLYFEIISGAIQERPGPLNPTAGFAYVEADLILTLSPFGGLLGAGETLINAISIRNTGTGSPDNVEAYGTGSGDMIFEGSPLNISFTPTTAATNAATVWLASIDSRLYDTSAAGSSATASTTFVSVSFALPLITPLYTNRGLKMRVMGRFSAMSTNAALRLYYAAGDSPSQYTAEVVPGSALAQLVDFGTIQLTDIFRWGGSATPYAYVGWQARSTTGGAIAVTLTAFYIIFYYDWCIAKPINHLVDPADSSYLFVESFVSVSGFAALPKPSPRAHVFIPASNASWACDFRGTAPRYFSGASLFAAWGNPAVAHATTQAATVTVTHAPLYFASRGAG